MLYHNNVEAKNIILNTKVKLYAFNLSGLNSIIKKKVLLDFFEKKFGKNGLPFRFPIYNKKKSSR